MQPEMAGNEAEGAPTLAVAGPRATIWLNRPHHHNRLGAADIAVFRELLARVDADRGLRVLVVAARGRTFCSGFDLRELATLAPDAPAPGFDRMVDELEALRPPTIAAVNGGIYGGGTDLALACDFRIGVTGMEMLMPAARIGVHYYFGGLRRYATRVGLGAAKRLFLAAEEIGAEELLRIGFVDRLVPKVELESAVDDLARRLAGNAPRAVQGMKWTLNQIASGTPDAAAADGAWSESVRSPDVAEGLAAHAEKRPPAFRDS
jgi:enoyl-CoA hydratase/carnithine racemase